MGWNTAFNRCQNTVVSPPSPEATSHFMFESIHLYLELVVIQRYDVIKLNPALAKVVLVSLVHSVQRRMENPM